MYIYAYPDDILLLLTVVLYLYLLLLHNVFFGICIHVYRRTRAKNTR